MRVLLSAYACEPDRGSEPEVGFRALLAAASRHEVWVLLNDEGVAPLERCLRRAGLGERVHLHPIPLGVVPQTLGHVRYHRHYDRWQRRAAAMAAELHRRVDFDVTHHVTLAAHWTRPGVAMVDKPFVWGPVGGGVQPPLSLMTELGVKGSGVHLTRFLGRVAMNALPPVRVAGRKALVVFAQNPASARRMRTRVPVEVLSNATAVELDGWQPSGPRTADVLVVGRLLSWKAVPLAVRAWRYVSHPRAMLRVYGDGPDRPRIDRAIRRWGLEDRVRVEGWVSRREVLRQIAMAGAVLHPSLHDEAGMAIAEALSVGTPVVCLDHGGPGEVIRYWPRELSVGVPPSNPDQTARLLAAAVDRFLDNPRPTSPALLAPETSFASRILAAYDRATARS